MPPKRRRFERKIGDRPYEKLFVIACEGEETEPQYFNLLKSFLLNEKVRLKPLSGKKKTSCTQVLDKLKRHLRENNVMEPYEAWLVIDKDDNQEKDLRKIYEWSQSKDNYGLALSNPKFEYWLLLHFDEAKGVQSSVQCSERLKRHLPDYDKGIDCRKITQDKITDAVKRAKQRDNPPCPDWPKNVGTTVYRLVEKLIQPRC
jgi:hypothetical protein